MPDDQEDDELAHDLNGDVMCDDIMAPDCGNVEHALRGHWKCKTCDKYFVNKIID